MRVRDRGGGYIGVGGGGCKVRMGDRGGGYIGVGGAKWLETAWHAGSVVIR